jgi:large subunit ribosomal protein L33
LFRQRCPRGASLSLYHSEFEHSPKSTASGHFYLTEKNRKNDPSRLELRRYDPFVRRHVMYKEEK